MALWEMMLGLNDWWGGVVQAGPLLGILTWALEFGFSLKCWRSMGHTGSAGRYGHSAGRCRHVAGEYGHSLCSLPVDRHRGAMWVRLGQDLGFTHLHLEMS